MSDAGPLKQPDEVQPLLSFFHCSCSVFSPAKALCDVKAQEPVAVSPFNLRPHNDDRLQRGGSFPEIQNDFFCFIYVEDKIIVLNIDSDLVDQVPV